MKNISVRDVMVPLDEYATVAQSATLKDAILALEKAQAEFQETRYRHRAVLVYDENDKIVGKISQMDTIRGLEPNYTKKLGESYLEKYGISLSFIGTILKEHDCWSLPLEQLCETAKGLKVSEIMYTPTEEEYIREDASLQNAVHHLIIGNHHSLLVTSDDEIIGVLRLSDVFAEVCRAIKECG
jgi:CBS domain-containing protein